MVEGKTFLETFSLHSCALNVLILTSFYGVISRMKIFFCHFDKLGTNKKKLIAVVWVPLNRLQNVMQEACMEHILNFSGVEFVIYFT
jgi:hypothetical protein